MKKFLNVVGYLSIGFGVLDFVSAMVFDIYITEFAYTPYIAIAIGSALITVAKKNKGEAEVLLARRVE